MSDTEPSNWSATLTWTTAGAMVERQRVAALQCRWVEATLARTVEVDSITWDEPKADMVVVDGWARPANNRHERRAEAAKARRR